MTNQYRISGDFNFLITEEDRGDARKRFIKALTENGFKEVNFCLDIALEEAAKIKVLTPKKTLTLPDVPLLNKKGKESLLGAAKRQSTKKATPRKSPIKRKTVKKTTKKIIKRSKK